MIGINVTTRRLSPSVLVQNTEILKIVEKSFGYDTRCRSQLFDRAITRCSVTKTSLNPPAKYGFGCSVREPFGFAMLKEAVEGKHDATNPNGNGTVALKVNEVFQSTTRNDQTRFAIHVRTQRKHSVSMAFIFEHSRRLHCNYLIKLRNNFAS
jgi:hypothetical protein